MYADFFGLRELPFNNTPDPRYFFPTPDHEEALASLIYAVNERKGFVLLSGEVGAGKTLVSRMMLRHFGTRIAFANINHATVGAQDLLESVLDEFEIARPAGIGNAQLVRLLHDFLLAQFSANTPVVLMLDEAQSLSVAAFEQLRMIGNLEADDAKLLQICILGQPELRTLFASAPLRQLRQRLFRSFHLGRLTRELTGGYIRHRLTIAGGEDLDLFNPDAVDRIHEHAGGIPRLINALCDNAMLSAYSAHQRTIAAELVDTVIAQMMTIEDVPEPAAGPRRARVGRPAEPAPRAAMPAPAIVEHAARGDAAGSFAAREPDTAPSRARAAAVADAEARLGALATRIESVERSMAEVVRHGETVCGQLAEREAKAVTVHDGFRTLFMEAKGVLQRVGEQSTGNAKAERHVKELYDDLVVQSQRTVRLAAVLRQVLDRVERRAEAIGAQTAPAPSSAEAAGVITPAGRRLPLRGGTAHIERLLDNSRETLSDLRTLLHETSQSVDGSGRSAHSAAERPPTDAEPAERLAEKVQSLLDYIERGEAAA